MVGGWGVPCPGLRGTVGGGVPCPDLPRPGRGRALGSLLWVGTMRTSGPGPTRRLGKGTLREARTCRVRRPPCGRLWLKRIRAASHGRAGCRGRGRPGCDAGGRALRVTVIALVPCRLHKLRQHTRLGGPDAACGDRSADPAGSLCAHPWDSLASITLSDAAGQVTAADGASAGRAVRAKPPGSVSVGRGTGAASLGDQRGVLGAGGGESPLPAGWPAADSRGSGTRETGLGAAGAGPGRVRGGAPSALSPVF